MQFRLVLATALQLLAGTAKAGYSCLEGTKFIDILVCKQSCYGGTCVYENGHTVQATCRNCPGNCPPIPEDCVCGEQAREIGL